MCRGIELIESASRVSMTIGGDASASVTSGRKYA